LSEHLPPLFRPIGKESAGMKTDQYASQSIEETYGTLQTDCVNGLNADDAAQRLEQYGYNELQEREEPLWHRIFRRFWGPIPWMIEIAALLSAVVEKWEDFGIIVVMLLVNAGLDFFQEHRALNALKALKRKLQAEALVLRDGVFTTIPARELVLGDVIKLRIGNVVPADVQLCRGDYLLVDQSSLTGESLPVSKKMSEVAYANTIVKQGEMLAVVVNTGAATNFHDLVALVARAEKEERSHFQKMVIRIGDFLILMTLALVVLVVLVALFRHDSFLDIIRFSLVLAVAAIPVALPAVLSVTMAVGAMNLARRQAIVSRLTAIEELAGVDIFCSDKTGTLTRNEMQVTDPVLLDGFDEQQLFLAAALASQLENRDPIEIPIFHYIDEHLPDLELGEYRQLSFAPFDPVRKRTEAVIEHGDERFTVIKGAAQMLMAMADMEDDAARNLTQMVDLLAAKGYRTLAVGRRETDEAPLEILGLIPLYDPPRDDSREVIATMQQRGVEVKMITGDNLAIAREIGALLGLPPNTMRSAQLSGTADNELMALATALSTAIYQQLNPKINMKEAEAFAQEVIKKVRTIYDTSLLEHEFVHTHESAIVEMIESITIFAEVVPEDKFRIVDSLQKRGHIVGMTGDGVNDAPALKRADCGIAVANATDAARAAADIILTAPGLGVINEAIAQARTTFERMKSYAIYRITETIRVVLFISLSIIVFNFYPITALMIILLALLNDIPILAIAYDNTRVDARPVRWNMPELLTISSMLGISGVLWSFLLFFLLRKYGFPDDVIQTMIFLKLIVAGHSTLYVTRSEGWFWQRPYPAPLLFAATFGTEIIGTLIAVYGIFITPIGWEYALWIWAFALAAFIFNDMVKQWTIRFIRRRPA